MSAGIRGRIRQPALERRPGPPFVTVLEVDDWERVRTRVVVSPMYTVAAGLWEIVAGRKRGVALAWAQTVLRRARGLDLAPFAFYATPGIRQPDFLFPLWDDPAPSFADELRALRATPAKAILGELDYEYGPNLPPVFADWRADPEAALDAYCLALGNWWKAVILPSWPSIETALQSEVLRVSRLLTTRGPREALAQVHHRLLVEEGSLWVDGGPIHERHALGDRAVILIPFASGPDAVVTTFDHPQGAIVAYAAQGVHSLLAGEPVPAGEDLEALLGEARGRIIVRLGDPATTTELAQALHYAPSTISEHLRTLTVMGLVWPTRLGRHVYYGRTERAERLIEVYR